MNSFRSNILAISLFTGFLIVQSGTVCGQATLGVKAGLNLSNLSLENTSDKNMVTGLHAGVFLNFPIAEAFSIQPELLFSQKGTKWDPLESVADAEAKLRQSYIDIPVNLVYNLAKDFDFQLGPYVGFLARSKLDKEFENDLEKADFNSLDFGVQGGLRFFLSPVYFGFTYKYGIMRVAKEGKISEDIFGDAANRTIQVYVALPF